MRKVVIDLLLAQPDGSSKYHGGGEYTKNVFVRFLKASEHSQIIACYDFSKYLDSDIKDDISEYGVETINTTDAHQILSFLNSLPYDDEIIFFAGMVYKYSNVVFPKNVMSVGVCHGLRFIELPKDRYTLYYSKNIEEFIKNFLKIFLPDHFLRNRNIKKMQDAISSFDIVYTVSNHSKYAIKVLLPENNNCDIRVHYQTLRHWDINNITNNDKTFQYQDFILMISSDRWEKNSYRGITALDELMSEDKLDIKNVVVLGNYPRLLRKKIRNIKRFIFLGYLDLDEFELMYKHCRLFFYPTLNEGYGLPPLEAMKYKKTCVISSVCSLTEVYGDSVYYCNPYNISEIKTRIVEAIDMPIDEEKITKRIALLEMSQELSTQKLLSFLDGTIDS